MKTLMSKIDSKDGLFHNGNPAIGEQGTRVTDVWLNEVQGSLRDLQAEAHYVLQKAGFKPIENTQTQLYESIVAIIGAHLPSATLTTKGITQLTNDTGLDSENLALSAKAGKKLAQQMAQLQQNVAQNYIHNNKKSDAVNSASSENVATSFAVKTAHDKAVDAKNAADDANSNANRRAFGLALSNEDLNSVTAPGIYGQNANANSTPERYYPIQQAGMLMVTGSSGYGAQQLYIPFDANYLYARGRNASQSWNDWKRIDGLNRVLKTGDTMTGNLIIDVVDSLLKGRRSGVDKYAVGLRNSTSNDVVVVNYTDNTVLELLANSVYANKTLIAPGMILDGSDYVGINLKNLSNCYVRIESTPHSSGSMLAFVYREANGTNINTVSLRKKGGTIALLEDASPAGLVAYFARTNAPTGWLKANGAAVSRTTYADLFAAIGTTFGAGNERTTFNLPDLRGEFVRGLDDGRGIDSSRVLGSWQKSSLIVADAEDTSAVHSLSTSASDKNKQIFADMVGADLINPSDYPHARQVWNGNSRDLQWQTVSDVVSKSMLERGHLVGGSRPRNIALLACIKY